MTALNVEVYATGIETLSRREVRQLHKEQWYQVGLRWRQEMMPLHFGRRATQRYRYQRRSRHYNQRKKQFVGHVRPLEFTGEGKRQAFNQRRMHSNSNRVVIKLPRKFNLRPATGTIRMADELRDTRHDERRSLSFGMVNGIRRSYKLSGATKARVRLA